MDLLIVGSGFFGLTVAERAARETVRWSMTIAVRAQPSPPREIFARGDAAFEVSCRHVFPQCAHW